MRCCKSFIYKTRFIYAIASETANNRINRFVIINSCLINATKV